MNISCLCCTTSQQCVDTAVACLVLPSQQKNRRCPRGSQGRQTFYKTSSIHLCCKHGKKKDLKVGENSIWIIYQILVTKFTRNSAKTNQCALRSTQTTLTCNFSYATKFTATSTKCCHVCCRLRKPILGNQNQFKSSESCNKKMFSCILTGFRSFSWVNP